MFRRSLIIFLPKSLRPFRPGKRGFFYRGSRTLGGGVCTRINNITISRESGPSKILFVCIGPRLAEPFIIYKFQRTFQGGRGNWKQRNGMRAEISRSDVYRGDFHPYVRKALTQKHCFTWGRSLLTLDLGCTVGGCRESLCRRVLQYLARRASA